MTILSQYKLVQQGATITKHDEAYHLRLPRCPVVIIFYWIDDILAGSLDHLIQYYSAWGSQHQKFLTWTALDSAVPSDLLKSFKLIPDLSSPEIRLLDSVHRALKIKWSPSEQEFINRLDSGTLTNADFDAKGVRKYFETFYYDFGELKGKAEGYDHDIVSSTE